jgi:hypothetical protein
MREIEVEEAEFPLTHALWFLRCAQLYRGCQLLEQSRLSLHEDPELPTFLPLSASIFANFQLLKNQRFIIFINLNDLLKGTPRSTKKCIAIGRGCMASHLNFKIDTRHPLCSDHRDFSLIELKQVIFKTESIYWASPT